MNRMKPERLSRAPPAHKAPQAFIGWLNHHVSPSRSVSELKLSL